MKFGHELEYDPYEEGLITGFWTQRDGTSIHISKMAAGHLRSTIRMLNGTMARSTCTDEEEQWRDWQEVLQSELDSRESVPARTRVSKESPRRSTATMKCHCEAVYQAREADIKRGWGLSCSKRCAAIRREFGRPAATKVEITL